MRIQRSTGYTHAGASRSTVPIYTYSCTSCSNVVEKRQSFSDSPLTTCEECGGALRKVIHPVGIVFKGSGWYITDSRSSASSANGSTSSSSETSASKDSGSGSKEGRSKEGESKAGGSKESTTGASKDSSTTSSPSSSAPATASKTD